MLGVTMRYPNKDPARMTLLIVIVKQSLLGAAILNPNKDPARMTNQPKQDDKGLENVGNISIFTQA